MANAAAPDDDWVKLLPITVETEAAAEKVLSDFVPSDRGAVSGINHNGVYTLSGDLFGNGGIYAVIGDQMTVTICQWRAESWKAVLSLDAGIGQPHPGRLCDLAGEGPECTKPFWMVNLQGQRLLVIASDEGRGGQSFYAVMFDAKGQNIVAASRSVAFAPMVKDNYLITREESRWGDWSTTHFCQIQEGRLVERKTWGVQRRPWLCWAARSDETVFRIMRDQRLKRSDWLIYPGELVRGALEMLTVRENQQPWARLSCRRTGPRHEFPDDAQEEELAYLFEKFTGLPRELYPTEPEFVVEKNFEHRFRVKVTDSKEAIELLSTSRSR